MPLRPKPIWIAPASRPMMPSRSNMDSGATPCCVKLTAKAESTAAAGAQGAEMSRELPPKVGATSPSTVAPRIPASAPCAASDPTSGEKIVTPNAIAEGSATNIAASPPQASPTRSRRAFDVSAVIASKHSIPCIAVSFGRGGRVKRIFGWIALDLRGADRPAGLSPGHDTYFSPINFLKLLPRWGAKSSIG
jgi:hypothetical protein